MYKSQFDENEQFENLLLKRGEFKLGQKLITRYDIVRKNAKIY